MSRRTVRLVVLSYALKSVLLVVLWILAPEVPRKALGHARAAWTSMLAWVAPTGG